MAYENIQITYPIFCVAPQIGTFATIDNSNPTVTRLIIKSDTGGLVREYVASSNIVNQILSLEYVGPYSNTSTLDTATFFTLERQDENTCLIKRWQIDNSLSVMSLKQTIVKTTSGASIYDITCMAVESYTRKFDGDSDNRINFFNVNDTSRLRSGAGGTVLFLGPSNDPDYYGKTEYVSVSSIVGNRVYLNSKLVNQYKHNDNVSFHSAFYLFSNKGYAGDETKGTVFKLNSTDGSVIEYLNKSEYQNVTAARWSRYIEGMGLVKNSNLLFVRPYDYYLNWKSLNFNNAVNVTTYTVYDVAFNDIAVYKLMKQMLRRQDVLGDPVLYTWTTYNYQPDTLLPYANIITVYTEKNTLIGNYDDTVFYVRVRDQFNVGLQSININFYKENDPGALFDPLNGQRITDSDGFASVNYTAGGSYEGPVKISVRADQSSPNTGSQYVWCEMLVFNKRSIVTGTSLFQNKEKVSSVYFRQINYWHKETFYELSLADPFYVIVTAYPRIYLKCLTYYTSAGGNWSTNERVASVNKKYRVDDVSRTYWSLKDYWPWFAPASGTRIDGPWFNPWWDEKEFGEPWNMDPGIFYPSPLEVQPRSNYIKQLNKFVVPKDKVKVNPDQSTELIANLRWWTIEQHDKFYIYSDPIIAGTNRTIGGGVLPIGTDPNVMYPDTYAKQMDQDFEMHLSQLKMSLHSYWVNGVYDDDLMTLVNINQFIFVEDAKPKFWSYKNPKETDIEIRVRPYATNINLTTFRFFIREIWPYGDTGMYEVTSQGVLESFDAGGGMLGVSFFYNPPVDFHHNSIIYVHLEYYDTAGIPNFVYFDYWFEVVADYKAPYITNLDPSREQDFITLDTNIYFEVKDDGAGVDISTLEVFLNSRIITPTNIEKVSDHHYKITCDLLNDLQYGKEYTVGVTVTDVSDYKNRLRDNYKFYTVVSEAPEFVEITPGRCKRGMPRFQEIKELVLSAGAGVDRDTIRIQVHDREVTDKSTMTPIIYRIS